MQVNTEQDINHRKGKMKPTKMGFPHPVAGHTDLHRKRSTDPRPELKIFNLTERIERQKENWYEHILRMKTDGLSNIRAYY
jgi:hypothetical protein